MVYEKRKKKKNLPWPRHKSQNKLILVMHSENFSISQQKSFVFSTESELKEKVKGPTLLLTFYASFDCLCAGVFAIVISMELEIGNLYWNDNVHTHTDIHSRFTNASDKTFMRLFSCVWFVRQCHKHFNFSLHILSVCGSGWKYQKVE